MQIIIITEQTSWERITYFWIINNENNLGPNITYEGEKILKTNTKIEKRMKEENIVSHINVKHVDLQDS